MKFSDNFFLKKKPTNKYNLCTKRSIQSGLSMYAFSVKKFYLLSCKDINTRSAYTSIDD